MLNIPELEKFDTLIASNSWLDEITGDLTAWSRGEYDDHRRKHHDCNLPTSTSILQFFKLPCNRRGWAELMRQRFNLSIPDTTEGAFFVPWSGIANGGDDLIDAFDILPSKTGNGWERIIDMIADGELDGSAAEVVIDRIMASEPLY